jgi:hypothetical protein
LRSGDDSVAASRERAAGETNLLERGFSFGGRNLGEEGRKWLDEIQKPYCGRADSKLAGFTGTRLQLARGQIDGERGDCKGRERTYSHSLWRRAREERPSGKGIKGRREEGKKEKKRVMGGFGDRLEGRKGR